MKQAVHPSCEAAFREVALVPSLDQKGLETCLGQKEAEEDL
jgi:hypothetical protein